MKQFVWPDWPSLCKIDLFSEIMHILCHLRPLLMAPSISLQIWDCGEILKFKYFLLLTTGAKPPTQME